MDKYPVELTSLLAPLVVIHGLQSVSEKPQIDKLHEQTQNNLTLVRNISHSAAQTPVEDASVKLVAMSDKDSVFYGEDDYVVKRRVPGCTGPLANQLAAKFRLHDIADRCLPPVSANGTEFSRRVYYKMQFVAGDEIRLLHEPQKAEESKLSVFNPNSPYYKTMLPLEWIQKYRETAPTVIMEAYELKTDPATDADLVKDINFVRGALNSRMVRFFALLICEDGQVSLDDLDARVTAIRRATRLPARTGLVYISAQTARDVGVFAESVMQSIAAWTTDFYNARIRKINLQEPLDAEYSQELWLVRQSVKNAVLEEFVGVTESSTKMLEHAYEKLVGCVRSVNRMAEKQPTLWVQCRSWLDFVGLHIVRSYLLLGAVSMAYRKFDIHVQNVLALLPDRQSYATYSWLATQATWLAQMFEKCPDSMIPVDRALQLPKRQGLFRSSAAAGQAPLPQGGYIYMQACFLLQKRRQAPRTPPVDPYMSLSVEEEARFNYSKQCIKVLNGSLDFFSRPKRTKFHRAESYVYFLLGEEYLADNNYSMAINNYIVSASAYKEERWQALSSIILSRLFQCSLKLANYEDAQRYFLRLAVLPERYLKLLTVASEKFTFDEDDSKHPKSVFKEGLFDISVVVRTPKVVVNEKVRLQVVLHSLQNSLVNHAIVEEVVVKFTNSFEELHVKHNPEMEREVISSVGSESNLLFEDSCRTLALQFDISPKAVGSFQVDSVLLKVRTLELDFSSQVKISAAKRTGPVRWLVPSTKFGKTFDQELLSTSGSMTKFDVVPRQPQCQAKFNYAEFAHNGQSFPIGMQITNKDSEGFGVEVVANVKVGDAQCELVWKDIEPDKIQLNEGDTCQGTCLVRLPLMSGLPSIQEYQSQSAVKPQIVDAVFNMNYKNSDNLVVTVTKRLAVPLLELFKTRMTIRPSIDSNIPSVFDTETVAEHPLPIPDRMWQCDASVENVSFSSLTLSDFKVEVESLSANGRAELVSSEGISERVALGGSENQTHKFRFKFRSACDGKILKRSIQCKIHVSLKYEDEEKNTQTFRGLLWKGSLPYMDPRLLVDLHEYDNGDIRLDYILENPTNRIFQFSRTLGTSEHFQISDYKNQSNFMVLPFTKEPLRFRYKIAKESAGQKLLRLPELKVYDLNYKVYLNQLIVTDKIQSGAEGIYYVNPQAL